MEVILIVGSSLDGKVTVNVNKSSKEFSNLLTEEMASPLYDLRANSDAVIVSGNTVRTDDPSLKSKSSNKLDRIIIDRYLTLPLTKKVFDGTTQTFIIYTEDRENRADEYNKNNIHLLKVSDDNFFSDLKTFLNKQNYKRVMIEGGGKLNSIMLKEKFIDKIIVAYFPFIIGGESTPTIVDGEGITDISNAIKTYLDKTYVVDKHMVVNEYIINYD